MTLQRLIEIKKPLNIVVISNGKVIYSDKTTDLPIIFKNYKILNFGKSEYLHQGLVVTIKGKSNESS